MHSLVINTGHCYSNSRFARKFHSYLSSSHRKRKFIFRFATVCNPSAITAKTKSK